MPRTKSSFTPPTLYDANRWRGLRIGLLGGSFNPAHRGHYHIARLAMAKFDLDFVWWMITPQNPLKDRKGMAPYDERVASVQSLIAGDPRMMATHLERDLKTTYTYDAVKKLRAAYPRTEFMFICGMDNARIFHRWDRWRELLKTLPVVFIARPPAGDLVRNCPARMLNHPNIRWLMTDKMVDISSTQIRNSNKNNKVESAPRVR